MRGEANGEEAPQQPHPVRGEEEEDDDERQQPDLGPPQQRRHGHAQRTASKPSSGQQQQQPPVAMRSVGYIGKHRLSAAIARLDQELQSLQEELNELDTMEPASAACQEVIMGTEGKPDPLLPITSGPENSSWDRWFQRVRSSHSNKWWSSKGTDFS
jgi:hypothetical protein